MALILPLTILTACSTVEFAHAPVGCLGQPVLPDNIKFTQQEIDKMDSITRKKIYQSILILRKRIDAQCAINKKHDELFGDKND